MPSINDRVKEEWTETTTARERVKEVLSETTEYTKASEIADQALVSEPTARKYLQEFVEDEVGDVTQDGQTTSTSATKADSSTSGSKNYVLATLARNSSRGFAT